MPKWSFDKTFWATWYPNQYYGSPQTIIIIMIHHGYGGSPNSINYKLKYH